jgi:hypothetical protein
MRVYPSAVSVHAVVGAPTTGRVFKILSKTDPQLRRKVRKAIVCSVGTPASIAML